jgi:CBS domain-containing protein
MAERTAKDVMTAKVITIGKDATIGELSRMLLKNKISGVPVVDGEGKLIGMVTDADIITEDMEPMFPIYFDPLIISYAFIENFEKYQKDAKEYLETKVEEIMARRVKSAKKDTPVSDIARIMVKDKINRIPVVDENNKVVGIIARADILKSMVVDAEKAD